MTHQTLLPSLAAIQDLDRSTQTITLKDGRALSFNSYGAPGGRPIFYFHGGPGSRLEGAIFHQAALEREYRVICLDRPGHGLSDPRPGYRILDLADDVRELADHLGLDRFGVMGLSGGGPPVFACAYRLGERLDCAVSLGGAAPIYTDPVASQALSALDRNTALLSVKLPRRVFTLLMGLMIGTFSKVKTGAQYQRVFRKLLCEADREIVNTNPAFVPAMMASIKEAFRGGAAGVTDDTVAIVKDWGFSLAAIDYPVQIVHGTEDKHVPYSFAEYLHNQVPNSKLIPLEGEGHYGHAVNVARTFEILEGVYPQA